jgi:hypothetical protein
LLLVDVTNPDQLDSQEPGSPIRFHNIGITVGELTVNDPKTGNRKFMTVVLVLLMAGILAVMIVGTLQYYGDKRHPDGVPETSGR